MARIAGVDLPRDKRVEAALPYIFGVGRGRAREICRATGVNPDTRVRSLAEDEVTRLREYIEKSYKVEGDLRRDIAMDIRRLVEIGAYRGIRHKKSLPVHGQRTRTNARTRKGPKKTVGVRKRAAPPAGGPPAGAAPAPQK
jgi:small subunit ribosomal protein S13